MIRRVREKKNGEKEQEERKQEKLDLLNQPVGMIVFCMHGETQRRATKEN